MGVFVGYMPTAVSSHACIYGSVKQSNEQQKDEVKTTTQADPQMKAVTKLLHDGELESWKICPTQVLEYCNPKRRIN